MEGGRLGLATNTLGAGLGSRMDTKTPAPRGNLGNLPCKRPRHFLHFFTTRHEHPYIADNGVDVHGEHEEVQQGIPFELVTGAHPYKMFGRCGNVQHNDVRFVEIFQQKIFSPQGQNIQSVRMFQQKVSVRKDFQHKIFSPQGCSSTKYSVRRATSRIPVPVQNIQSARPSQCKI